MLAFLLAVSDGKHNAEIIELYNKYSADMLVLAKSYLKRKNQFDYEVAAEDAVQNAFLKIIRYSHKIRFDEPEKMVRAYVYAVLINECKLLIKENHIEIPISECERCADDKNFFEELCIKERFETVVAAIKTLDERYSITIFYHCFKEMSVKEIAAMMGISEKTVYTRILRGRVALLKALGEVGALV